MSRLDEVMKGIRGMTDEELLARVRQVRAERRVSRKPEKKHTRAKRIEAKDKLAALLANLSPEEVAQMLGKK